MDLSTVSHLVGVTGASFMSSNALFSLFNWKMRNIRDKTRKDYGKAREEHQRKKTCGKTEKVGLVVLCDDMNTASRWFLVWLVFNIAPVAISVILAFIVSAPVVIPSIQGLADQWLVLLLKWGVWGLVISLFFQTGALVRMFCLRRQIDKRMEASPNDVFQK